MIYVLGSLNMDLTFSVPRIPKGGETISSSSFETFCGGKGANQAIALAKLSSKVKMIGGVGSDDYGKRLRSNLIANGVDVEFVRENGPASGLAAILVDKKGQNRIILHGGANMRVEKRDVDEGLKNAKAGDVLLAQLEIPLGVVEYAFSLAKEKGMTTVLNPAPAVPLSSALFASTDIITPNETETEILTGVNPKDIVQVALAVKSFYEKGVKNVIITLGSRGAVVSHGQNITEIAPKKVKVVDTTAAGDTFVGAVCNRLENGFDIVEACMFANCASSITIQRKGASDSIPTIEEVEAVYSS